MSDDVEKVAKELNDAEDFLKALRLKADEEVAILEAYQRGNEGKLHSLKVEYNLCLARPNEDAKNKVIKATSDTLRERNAIDAEIAKIKGVKA